jgi:hypothetical protein
MAHGRIFFEKLTHDVGDLPKCNILWKADIATHIGRKDVEIGNRAEVAGFLGRCQCTPPVQIAGILPAR